MKRLEWFELGLIVLVTVLTWVMAGRLPLVMGLGRILLICSALLLFQGLLRDLVLLHRSTREKQQANPRQALCMCMESTVGITGIVAGSILLLGGFSHSIGMSEVYWTGLIGLTLVTGFLIKDLVIETGPLRIVRDPDHVNIIVKWKP